jgi:hypothetical protein
VNIEFNVPHVFSNRSSRTEDAEVLRVLLESLIAVNRVFVRHHTVKSLYRSGVVYGRTREWDSIPALMVRGYGDCKSVTAWRIAELREAGITATPVFRFMLRDNGFKDFHILVKIIDKNNKTIWEDPSKALGMGQNENAHFSHG